MANEHVSATKSFVTSQNCARKVVVTLSSTFVEKNPAQQWESQPRLVTWHHTPPWLHRSHLLLILIRVHTRISITYCSFNDEFSTLFVQSQFIASLTQVTKLYLSGQTSDHV